MRNILKDRCGLDYSNLLQHRYQALQYLMCRARDIPNRWVCEHCVKFHAVRFNDFPLLQLPDSQLADYGYGCSYPRFCQCQRCEPARECQCRRQGTPAFYICHAHVQLALKYTRIIDRLDEGHRLYLRKLLTPVHVNVDMMPPNMQPGRPPSHYTMRARVVNGRFLLLLQFRWSRHMIAQGVNPMEEGLCSYQRAAGETWANAESLTGGHFGWEPQLTGTCSYCASDFLYTSESGVAFLHVWQDLGAEEAIVHACCGTGRRKGELRYGSVRALYESVDRD
ncbi:hypothetical protein EsDP_00001299 [Epichloe bromicola]|uniref:Uncharacterized protein n=1 Tax=Epichloe bromicola TaxID=79588 RepID=A0ABQ0CHH1_9HYPO